MARRLSDHIASMMRTCDKDWVLHKYACDEEERREIISVLTTFITTHVLLTPIKDEIVVLVFIRRENGNSFIKGLQAFFEATHNDTGLAALTKLDTHRLLRVCGNYIWDMTEVQVEKHESMCATLSKLDSPPLYVASLTKVPGTEGHTEQKARRCCSVFPALLGGCAFASAYQMYREYVIHS